MVAALATLMMMVTACGDDDDDGGKDAAAATASSGGDETTTTAAAAPGSEISANMGDLVAECESVRETYPDLEGRTIGIVAGESPNIMETDSSSPNGFKGSNSEIAESLSLCLGFDYNINIVAFDGIIPSLQSERYDMALANMFDTPPRREVVNYVLYELSPQFLMVPTGNPLGIKELAAPDLCGVSFAQNTGGYAVPLLQGISEDCEAQGLDGVEIQEYATTPEGLEAFRAGRADAKLDGPATVAPFLDANPGKFEVAVGADDGPVIGAQFPKNDDDLPNAVLDAFKLMQSTGVFVDIFERWRPTELGDYQIDLENYMVDPVLVP